MDTTRLPPDFKEFLKSLNSNDVRYLVIGGYAVGYHGYPRATIDLDVWVDRSLDNARRVLSALDEFGFSSPGVAPAELTLARKVFRMGVPPLRIEILTTISGSEFSDCFARRTVGSIDGTPVSVICLDDLRRNKLASGRRKDLVDIDHLPGAPK